MLPSKGYFSCFNCPYFSNGCCERLHCHFRHKKQMMKMENVLKLNENIPVQQGYGNLLDNSLGWKQIKQPTPTANYKATPISELRKLSTVTISHTKKENDDLNKITKLNSHSYYMPNSNTCFETNCGSEYLKASSMTVRNADGKITEDSEQNLVLSFNGNNTLCNLSSVNAPDYGVDTNSSEITLECDLFKNLENLPTQENKGIPVTNETSYNPNCLPSFNCASGFQQKSGLGFRLFEKKLCKVDDENLIINYRTTFKNKTDNSNAISVKEDGQNKHDIHEESNDVKINTPGTKKFKTKKYKSNKKGCDAESVKNKFHQENISFNGNKNRQKNHHITIKAFRDLKMSAKSSKDDFPNQSNSSASHNFNLYSTKDSEYIIESGHNPNSNDTLLKHPKSNKLHKHLIKKRVSSKSRSIEKKYEIRVKIPIYKFINKKEITDYIKELLVPKTNESKSNKHDANNSIEEICKTEAVVKNNHCVEEIGISMNKDEIKNREIEDSLIQEKVYSNTKSNKYSKTELGIDFHEKGKQVIMSERRDGLTYQIIKPNFEGTNSLHSTVHSLYSSGCNMISDTFQSDLCTASQEEYESFLDYRVQCRLKTRMSLGSAWRPPTKKRQEIMTPTKRNIISRNLPIKVGNENVNHSYTGGPRIAHVPNVKSILEEKRKLLKMACI